MGVFHLFKRAHFLKLNVWVMFKLLSLRNSSCITTVGRIDTKATGEGCPQFVHGRSRMTRDPSIPTMPGREHVGFSPTRQTMLAPSEKRREMFGESHEG